MEKNIYQKRREMLLKQLPSESIGIVPSYTASSDLGYDPSFYYLTGLMVNNAVLIIMKDKEKDKAIIYRPKLDPVLAKWIGSGPSDEEIKKVSAIEDIRDISEYIIEKAVYEKASSGFDKVFIHYIPNLPDMLMSPSQRLVRSIKDFLPHLNIQWLSPFIYEQRRTKSPDEINRFKEAIKITRKGLIEIFAHRSGYTNECQVYADYTGVLHKENNKKSGFNTIVAAGKNATILHYDKNNSPIHACSLILIDTGCDYMGYQSDITRCFPRSKAFPKKSRHIYQAVLDAQEEIIKMVKPNITLNDLNEKSKDVLTRVYKDAKIIKKPEDLFKVYYHGISHYLGLEVHDVGIRSKLLKPGCVITIEPGCYIEEQCIGVRIEDDILVTSSGHENLSHSIPKKIEDIENL